MGREKYWLNTLQIASEKTVIHKKFSTVTLLQEFKPVALENYEFEDRRNINIKWTLSHFRTIKIPIEGTQSEIAPSKKHLKNISRSIQTLIEEFKSVVFEKDEPEYRDISIWLALLPLLVNQDYNYDVEKILPDN